MNNFIHRFAEFLKPRLWLGWVCGGMLWLIWLISIAIGGGTYDMFGQLVCTDHIAFYSAARMVRDGDGKEIYNLPHIAERQIELVGEQWRGKYEAYRNPPFYTLLYWPTAKWPYVASAAFWTVLSIISVAWGVLLIADWNRHIWKPLAWSFCFYPIFATIAYGQNSALSFLIFAGVYRLMKSNRLFTAGCLAGLLCFKPTLLLGLIVWTLIDIRRLWPCALGAATTVLLLCGLSYAIMPEVWTAFLASLKDNATFDQMEWWKNLTPRAFWRLLIGPVFMVTPLTVITALLGIGVFARSVFRKGTDRNANITWNPAKGLGLAVLLTLWITPHAMIYEWLILLIPALLFWFHTKVPSVRWFFLFAIIFVCSLAAPFLSQIQLKIMPYAVHIVVIIFGWVSWLAAKWLDETNTPLKADLSNITNA